MESMPDHHPHQKLVGRLTLETPIGAFLGGTRIRLLEAIDRHGSISQAAKTLPLSYKAAWDAVEDMNNLGDEPLVERSVGGAHGGGTIVTAYGKRMVAFYRAIEENYQELLERSAQSLGEDGANDIHQFRRLMRRMAMKTSARNQFVGPVTALRDGAVNVEVRLRLDARNELTAMITRESADRLGLRIGDEVHAFVKAPSVVLATDRAIRTSARNELWGTVDRVLPGAVNAEISLLLPSGRSVIAVVTNEGARKAGLDVGVAACALIMESSVMLATFG
jgi:molybdate transport system regulatory protein